jgi:hypothetical protein
MKVLNGNEYIEKAMEEIRNTWFNKHVVEVEGEKGLQVIHWGQPGSNFYRVKYVLSGRNLFIAGDIGEAVYDLTFSASLESLVDCNLSYLTKKLSAHSNDRWRFDEDYARQEFESHWKENDLSAYYGEDAEEIQNSILSAISESVSPQEFSYHIWDTYHSTSLEGDEAEWLEDLGKRLPYRFIAFWLGLRMAYEQLKVKEEVKQ